MGQQEHEDPQRPGGRTIPWPQLPERLETQLVMEQNETELYRLDDDEGERNDLASAQPKRTRKLLETLNQWVKETR
jgi:hypothetical protein